MTRLKLAALAALVAGTAQAQDDVAQGQAFGDWIVACEAVSTTRNACRIAQSQSRSSDGSLVLQLVAYPQAQGGAVLVAQVPMGVYLPDGATFRPRNDDDADSTGMIWQRCLGNICEAALRLDADGVAAFADAGEVLFGYRMIPGEPATITTVDTSTFVTALDAVR